MFGGDGSALEAAAAPSERLLRAKARVARLERLIRELSDELVAARNTADTLDVWPRSQGWY